MSGSVETKTVLILDSDAQSTKLFDSFFPKVGFNPIYVKTEEEAIAALGSQDHAIFLVDIFKSGLRGLNTLKEIQEIAGNRKIPVIVVSNKSDKELIKTCIKHGASDFLLKPIDNKEFVTCLSRFVKLQTSKQKKESKPPEEAKEKDSAKVEANTNEEPKNKTLIEILVEKLKHDKLDFSVMPQLGYKVIELLKDEKVQLTKVNKLIEKDPGILSRILKAANSAVYAAGKPVYTPKDAILRIGVKKTINYILVVSSARLFENPNPVFEARLKEILTHSLCAAVCAREIAGSVSHPHPDNLFAFGLLHDIGKVLLLRILNDISSERDLSDEEMITELLEKLHTRFGASLMRKWNFPQDFHEAVLHHHDQPSREKHLKSTVITSFANLVANDIDDGVIKKSAPSLIRMPHSKLIGYNSRNFDKLVKKVNDEKKVLAKLLE